MAMTKLALLMALAIGGLALGDARPQLGRGLLASTTFTCSNGGEPFDGNNRGAKGNLISCAAGTYLCSTKEECDSDTCDAVCKDGTVLTATRNPATGIVTIKNGGVVVVPEAGQYKGCNAYCQYTSGVGGVPLHIEDGKPCGFSHADFCYRPCRCDKTKVKFYYDGTLVQDVSLCPGAALPDKTKYTAVDNCGKTLVVTVTDSPKNPVDGACGTITRTLTAPCGDEKATKDQKITYEDSAITFIDGCPVRGGSTCVAAKDLSPVVTYKDCVFKAEYTLANACGVDGTKTVTCPSCAP